jgi:hypothetical protein
VKNNDKSTGGPWRVTLVQTQLDEMAGVCNELHRANREIKFIVPISPPAEPAGPERSISHIAVFSLPREDLP